MSTPGANLPDEGSSIPNPPGRPRPVSSSIRNFINAHRHSPQSTQAAQYLTASRKSTGLSSGSTKYCLCSPTSHVGSFRCRLHRSANVEWPTNSDRKAASPTMTVAVRVPNTVERNYMQEGNL